LLEAERAAIVTLSDGWAGIDRSHRKLAHRGSRPDVVPVSESTILRLLGMTSSATRRHGFEWR
jgi:hypothetical protein